MGLDYSALLLCRILHIDHGDFGQVLTIGRQQLCVNKQHLNTVGIPSPAPMPSYCESLLIQAFGATSVESLDASDYEGSTIVADLNKRSQKDTFWYNQFDTVLDFGTLEHVFDVRNAFDEVSNAARIGGTVVHLLPANQECGHGFYQFTPEFFFSYFSSRRGFTNVRVMAVEPDNPEIWYELEAPRDGERLYLRSGRPLYIACIATRSRNSLEAPIQQSDYAHMWTLGDHSNLKDSRARKTDVDRKPIRSRFPSRFTVFVLPPYRSLRRRLRILKLVFKPLICDGKVRKIKPLLLSYGRGPTSEQNLQRRG